jgi:molybdate transport system substrate-binding protein
VRAQEQPLTVFAAASLTDALRALGQDWTGRGNPAPRFSFAPLARAPQIEQWAGRTCSLGGRAWKDYPPRHATSSCRDEGHSEIGNALVLVDPGGPALQVTLDRGNPTLRRCSATGGSPPATRRMSRSGATRRRAGGGWDSGARSRRASTARTTCAPRCCWSSAARHTLGIVYATDAAASRGVAVAGTFPAGSHPPVTYPFAVTRRAEGDARARALHAFLAGPEALPTWQRFGFSSAR